VGRAFLAAGGERELLFVGSQRGLEARVVPLAGLPYRGLPTRGWRGKGAGERILFLRDATLGVASAVGLMRRFRPDAVLGTGSYASLPVLAAARLLRVPYFLQEQNSVPGQVIRLFSPGARALFLAYEEAAQRLSPRPPHFVTGNPLREEFLALAAARRAAGRPAGTRRLLVFGGSHGASSLNRAVADALPALACDFEFEAVVQTGEKEYAAIRDALAGLAPSVKVLPYLENMAEEMARSHWVLCRSGAMTLAEITLMGLPAILVPFPHAVDDHQTRNAGVLASAGAARLIADEELDGPRLAATLVELWRSPSAEGEMSRASASLGRPDATTAILDLMEKNLAGPRGR